MLTSIPVYAAGSSTGANTDRDSTSDTSEDVEGRAEVSGRLAVARTRIEEIRDAVSVKRTELRREFSETNCEDEESLTRLQRIRCRIAQGKDYIAPENTIPEACRRLSDGETDKKVNPVACIALYKKLNSDGCYDLGGRDRVVCLKKAAGIVKDKLSDEPLSERPAKARKYLVTLLYDLQERIESLIEEDKLSPEDGAVLIDKIVEIKESIMGGATRVEVKRMLQELRTEWRSLVSEAESIKEEKDE